jgi:hypothetical protein
LTGHERDANPAAGTLVDFAGHVIKSRPGGSKVAGSQLPHVEKTANFIEANNDNRISNPEGLAGTLARFVGSRLAEGVVARRGRLLRLPAGVARGLHLGR